MHSSVRHRPFPIEWEQKSNRALFDKSRILRGPTSEERVVSLLEQGSREIIDRTGGKWRGTRWIRGSLHTILCAGRVHPKSTVSVAVVTAAESQRLNRCYRKKNTPTNILSFMYARSLRPPWVLAGELVMCARVVEVEARHLDISVRQYTQELLIHGVLHLIGYTHDHDQTAARMARAELRLKKKISFLSSVREYPVRE